MMIKSLIVITLLAVISPMTSLAQQQQQYDDGTAALEDYVNEHRHLTVDGNDCEFIYEEMDLETDKMLKAGGNEGMGNFVCNGIYNMEYLAPILENPLLHLGGDTVGVCVGMELFELIRLAREEGTPIVIDGKLNMAVCESIFAGGNVGGDERRGLISPTAATTLVRSVGYRVLPGLSKVSMSAAVKSGLSTVSKTLKNLF